MGEGTKSASNWSWSAAVIALVIGGAMGAGAMYLFGSSNSERSNGTAPPPSSPKNVSALGRIQPAGGLLTLSVPMPDQVVKIGDTVKEGEILKEGDTVVVLSGNTEHKLKWELAKIQLEDAKEQLKSIEASADLKIKADQLQIDQLKKMWPGNKQLQQAKIDVVNAKLTTADKNLKVLSGLTSVSLQEKEEKELMVLELKNQLRAAKLELEQMKQGHELKLEAANAELAASKAKKEQALQKLSIESAKKNVALAKSMYERTIVKAPITGKVIALFARVGELVGSVQPILTMADTDNMMVVAEVYETDRNKVKVGQIVEIYGRALENEKMTGKVVHISDRVGPNEVTPTNPLEKVDRRVVEVKIDLDDDEQAAHLINHQVTVTFLSKEK